MKSIDELKAIAKENIKTPIIGGLDSKNNNVYNIYGTEDGKWYQLKINGGIERTPISKEKYNLIVKCLKIDKKRGIITFEDDN